MRAGCGTSAGRCNAVADLAFWNGRLQRFGHTGWADAATYAYDQRLRLRAVASLIDTHTAARRDKALDFGCGTGDFSALLLTRFEAVTAHDISQAILNTTRQRVPSSKLRLTTDQSAALADGPYDLILSVTVLQHVLDDAELQSLAADFAAALAPSGRIVVLETLATQGSSSAGYLKGRTEVQLCSVFERAGLVLLTSRGFPHPTEAPTAEFSRYRRRLDVRLLGRMATAGVAAARRRLDAIARRSAAKDDGVLAASAGPTRLLEFARAGELQSRAESSDV